MFPLFTEVASHVSELRDLLSLENERGSLRFKDFDWRLNIVTACRQRNKMMAPKYSLKLSLQEVPVDAKQGSRDQKSELLTLLCDIDYTNLKRFQSEL